MCIHRVLFIAVVLHNWLCIASADAPHFISTFEVSLAGSNHFTFVNQHLESFINLTSIFFNSTVSLYYLRDVTNNHLDIGMAIDSYSMQQKTWVDNQSRTAYSNFVQNPLGLTVIGFDRLTSYSFFFCFIFDFGNSFWFFCSIFMFWFFCHRRL